MKQALATWPGLPLRLRSVYVPEDAQGDLWGPREHDVLHVDARWPGQERPEIASAVTWRRTTVGELVDRLPEGATTTVPTQGIDGNPRALDPAHRLKDVHVRRLEDDDPFASVARHQGAPTAFHLVHPEQGVLLLGITHEAAERSKRDFADDCALSRIPEPAALWAQDDLPRRLRKLLASV